AVHRHERPFGARPGPMQPTRHHLLAGAGLTPQQDRQVMVEGPLSLAQQAGNIGITMERRLWILLAPQWRGRRGKAVEPDRWAPLQPAEQLQATTTGECHRPVPGGPDALHTPLE